MVVKNIGQQQQSMGQLAVTWKEQETKKKRGRCPSVFIKLNIVYKIYLFSSVKVHCIMSFPNFLFGKGALKLQATDY
jgi:hypothetical protein